MVAQCCAVSIVVPVLNDAGPLERLLSSLQNMRNALWEIIVVDGGSVDESLSIAERFADLTLKSAAGRARQMNAGAGAARGEMIWFVHADAIISADLMSALTELRFLQETVAEEPPHKRRVSLGRADGCWGRCDVRLDHPAAIFRVIERMMNWRSRVTAIATGDQGIFVSRQLFLRMNGYADIPLMEDVELCARLRNEMPPLCLRTRIGASSRRWIQHGTSKTIILMWWLRLLYFFGVSPSRLYRYYYVSQK